MLRACRRAPESLIRRNCSSSLRRGRQGPLEDAGERLADADLQIAATAIVHGLAVVTGNVRHFERVPGLVVERVLADARA